MENFKQVAYTVVVKSYGQYCAVAKALDLVGDRWTLLIVRELLLQGPCRYTDLRNGLPGIATNLLADRLADLEAVGLVARAEQPPPAAHAVYSLTADGRDLEPVVQAIGVWGLRRMSESAAGDAFRGHWLAFPAGLLLGDNDPSGDPVQIEVRTAGERAALVVANGTVTTRVGAASSPALVVSGEPPLVLGLLTGHIDLPAARAAGVVVDGDPAALLRVVPKSPAPLGGPS